MAKNSAPNVIGLEGENNDETSPVALGACLRRGYACDGAACIVENGGARGGDGENGQSLTAVRGLREQQGEMLEMSWS